MNKYSKHLWWLHDRLLYHGDNLNVDFLHKFREIIKWVEDNETNNNIQRH